MLLDISRIHRDRAARAVLGVEAHFLQQLLHHRLQPAGTDILDLAIHLGRDPRHRANAVLGELDGHALGADQRLVLRRQRCLGVGEDRDEIILGQALQLDADRQAALKLGQ